MNICADFFFETAQLQTSISLQYMKIPKTPTPHLRNSKRNSERRFILFVN